MVGFRLTAAACILASFWTLHALKINQVRTFFSRIKQSAKKVDWLSLVKRLQHTADKLSRYRKTIKFDISAGYGSISSPELAPLDVLSEILEVEVVSRKSPVLWAHQVVKKTVKKAPDKALLGVLVLIASELLRRGVNSDKYVLPPLLREIANNTSIELDAKLEMLSSLDWKADPFLKGEYENLQSQPLEVLDKFIVTSILPSVDKDLAPFLLKSMVGDTAQVKIMVQSLKEVIKISMLVLEKTATGNIQTVAPLLTAAPSLLDQTTLTINRTTSTIISQVDFVGQGIEEVVNDWNRNVLQFSDSITEYLTTDSILNLINKRISSQYVSENTTSITPDSSKMISDEFFRTVKSQANNSNKPKTLNRPAPLDDF